MVSFYDNPLVCPLPYQAIGIIDSDLEYEALPVNLDELAFAPDGEASRTVMRA